MPNIIQITDAGHNIDRLECPIVVVNRPLAKHVQVAMHQHAWGQFVYASDGVLLVIVNQQRYIVPSQQGVWVPPNTPHEVTSQTTAMIISLYIDETESAELPREPTVLGVSSLLKGLLLEAAKPMPTCQWQGSAGRLLRLIRDFIVKAPVTTFPLPYPKDKRLTKAVSIIEKNRGKLSNSEEICLAVGMSLRHFSRLFKLETGITFSEWKLRQRIQLAIQLLSTGHSVKASALMLGYDSASTFIAMFKQQLGLTPGEYMRQQVV